MKKVFLSFMLCSCFLVISVVLWTGPAYAPPPSCAPVAQNLAACNDDLAACEAGTQVFPGDGYGSPDAFGVCGFAGYQDWRIPNVKELQSIVDYSIFNPSSSLPGLTRTAYYFSATTVAFNTPFAWIVSFGGDGVNIGIRNKCDTLYVRAVRP